MHIHVQRPQELYGVEGVCQAAFNMSFTYLLLFSSSFDLLPGQDGGRLFFFSPLLRVRESGSRGAYEATNLLVVLSGWTCRKWNGRGVLFCQGGGGAIGCIAQQCLAFARERYRYLVWFCRIEWIICLEACLCKFSYCLIVRVRPVVQFISLINPFSPFTITAVSD